MNGGKDFSEWSKKDDLLYRTLRTPVEAVLKKDGHLSVFADCLQKLAQYLKNGPQYNGPAVKTTI